MELIFWWMPLAWFAVIALAVLATVLIRSRRSSTGADARPVAHSSRLTALPGFRKALARYRAVLAGLAAAALVVLVASIGLASRPAAETIVRPKLNNRDIVLCLDVSGSMVEYDTEIVKVFGRLASEFDGERIGLVVFNASAVTYFPLTSDYRYVADQLGEITAQFDSDEADYFDGTFFGDGSSLIGDGLASCIQRFDTPDEQRSRSVILATDNLVVGDPIFSLEEAGRLAAEREIRVYGINPGDQTSREYLDTLSDEFEGVVTDTGGSYYALSDPTAVSSIVTSIGSQEAALIQGAPQLIQADQPAIPVIAGFLGLIALVAIAWRLER